MFENKTVLITGASSGLGKVLAVDFARQKANLVLAARNKDRLTQTENACHTYQGRTLCIPTDVTKPEACKLLVEKAVEHFGRIDYLVANAGISMWAKFEEIQDLSIFRKLMSTNYFGVVYSTFYALPHLVKSRGTIVAISSVQGKIGVPEHTGYAASKFAVNGFLEALRTEIADNKVRILTVMPHWLKGTDLRQNALGADGKTIGEQRRKHSSESITLEYCSNAIINAIKAGKQELIVPPKLRILPWLKQLSPRLLESIVKRKVNQQNK